MRTEDGRKVKVVDDKNQPKQIKIFPKIQIKIQLMVFLQI